MRGDNRAVKSFVLQWQDIAVAGEFNSCAVSERLNA